MAWGKLYEAEGQKAVEHCVFISHKREDTEDCEPIAEYLKSAGIDVYFDKYDKTLSEFVKEGNPDKVTERIQQGIEKSTHMICVVSTQTVTSYWVPFEVGYGQKKVVLGVLTLKGVQDKDLPDYMRTTEVIIRGLRSLDDFIADLLTEEERDALKSTPAQTARRALINLLEASK